MVASKFDQRMMAAAIRYSYRNLGRTGTNPSVVTLLVQNEDGVPVIVGRGITAIGGRPHAETAAILEAGKRARGATAYVTLEPCAHHGSTPPCAEALVRAGIARIVCATTDPDVRVSGRGFQILRDAGIEVETDVLAAKAQYAMAGYLMQRRAGRPHVTLKMALSKDARIGLRSAGQVKITGPESNAMVHVMRARSDLILIGIGTALEDDPSLTCRLPGLEDRSPTRLVLDRHLRLPLDSALVRSARDIPLIIATTQMPDNEAYRRLASAGCMMMACEEDDTGIALPELLDDLANRGFSAILVEGGAAIARSFINAALVDRIALYQGPCEIGENGIDAPLNPDEMPKGFVLHSTRIYGKDLCREYERTC